MLQIIINSIIEGSAIGLLAICFGIIYNTSRVFHFAFGALYTLSVYFFYSFLGWLGIVFIGIIAITIECLIYYPLFKKDNNSTVTMISSLGVYIVIINFIAIVWGNETKILTEGIQTTYQLGNIVLTKIQIIIFIISLLFIFLFIFFIKKTNLGNKFIAVGENIQLSSAIGLNVRSIRILGILIGTVLSSFVAILKGIDVGIDPYIGMNIVLTSAVAFIISGGKNYVYVALSGVLLGFIRNLSVWFISAQWMDAVTFICLIIFLIYKNRGFFVEFLRLEEQ